jgi:hypothetical protein
MSRGSTSFGISVPLGFFLATLTQGGVSGKPVSQALYLGGSNKGGINSGKKLLDYVLHGITRGVLNESRLSKLNKSVSEKVGGK